MSYLGLAAGTILILAAVRYKVNVGIAAAVAGLIVALTSSGGVAVLTASLGEAVIEPAGRTLLVSIAFITMIGNIMKVSGALDDLIDTGDGIARAVRVGGSHRSVMAGVHRLQQIQRLARTYLADDDPVRPHSQCVNNQVSDGDLTFAFNV